MRPGPPRPPFRPRSPTSRQSTPRSRPPSPRRPSRAASWWRNILTKSWIVRVRGWPSQPVGLVGCVMLRVRRSVVGWVQQELERRIWSTTKRLSIGSNQKLFFRMVMALCSLPLREVSEVVVVTKDQARGPFDECDHRRAPTAWLAHLPPNVQQFRSVPLSPWPNPHLLHLLLGT